MLMKMSDISETAYTAIQHPSNFHVFPFFSIHDKSFLINLYKFKSQVDPQFDMNSTKPLETFCNRPSKSASQLLIYRTGSHNRFQCRNTLVLIGNIQSRAQFIVKWPNTLWFLHIPHCIFNYINSIMFINHRAFRNNIVCYI